MFRDFLRVPAAACAFLTFSMLATGVAPAQPNASVTGTVSCEGVPVAGARVTLSSDEGVHASATSDAHGNFTLSNVPPGTYEVSAVAPGYAPLEDRTVSVENGGHIALELVRATNTSLAVIGRVQASAGETVSNSSAPVTNLNAQTAASAGVPSAAAMVWPQLATTAVLPLGGGDNAVQTFALRGPDPTETLVAIDGHQVNNGGTGDFDLTLLDPAALSNVQLVYGISPSSLVGPNTIGGAINVQTLEPSLTDHYLFRGFAGSYNTFGQTLQATGTTSDRLGYALSLHRATSSGSVNGNLIDSDGDPISVGSASFGESAIGKLRYQLGSGYGFIQASFRDQASNKDLSSLLTSYTPPGFAGGDDLRSPGPVAPGLRPHDDDEPTFGYSGFQNTWQASHQNAYGFDAQVPLGGIAASGAPATMLRFSHLSTLSSQSVNGPGAATSPYLYNQHDTQGDDWLELDHQFSNGNLSLKYDLLTEKLDTQYVAGIAVDQAIPIGGGPVTLPMALPLDAAAKGPAVYDIPLAQTQRTAALRYTYDPTENIHFAVAGYLSNFSTFGTSFDPRFGVTWTPTGNTSIRGSVGTTFQAAQLTELIQLPSLPPPVGGIISVGNPNLKPDHATVYDIGGEQIFGHAGNQTHISLDVYRTNVRDQSATLAVVPGKPGCYKKGTCPISMPINAGDAVYTGINAELTHDLGKYVRLRAGWDVNSSYLTSPIPASVQTKPDPTVLANQQVLGQPLHKSYLGLQTMGLKLFNYGFDVNWEGTYNELNRSPYATLDAQVLYAGNDFQIGLYGTNLTNTYANPFTIVGGGVPYGTPAGEPMIPTDQYILQGTKIVLVVTHAI